MLSLAACAEEISPRLIILYRVTNGHFTFILYYTYLYTFITHTHAHTLPFLSPLTFLPKTSECMGSVYVHVKTDWKSMRSFQSFFASTIPILMLIISKNKWKAE